MTYEKVLGTDNPADLLTKYLTADVLVRHCCRMDATFPEGRAEKAPTLNSMYVTQAIWELESPEGESRCDENDDVDRENWQDQLQLVVNEVWHRKWRAQVARLQKW